ncbi:hypothetical protein DFJ73DRAFT_885790 [Zopfochytrium polystomum]|nr:hypothetical protein DFJ73DRAFT_885790 [Zopfochytrium polystomum]
MKQRSHRSPGHVNDSLRRWLAASVVAALVACGCVVALFASNSLAVAAPVGQSPALRPQEEAAAYFGDGQQSPGIRVHRRASPPQSPASSPSASTSTPSVPLKSVLKKPKTPTANGRKVSFARFGNARLFKETDEELASRRALMKDIRAKVPEAVKDVQKDVERDTPLRRLVGKGPKYHSKVAPEAAVHRPVKLSKKKPRQQTTYYSDSDSDSD